MDAEALRTQRCRDTHTLMAAALITYLTWDFLNHNFNAFRLFSHIGAITGVCLKPTDNLNDTKGLEPTDDRNDTKGLEPTDDHNDTKGLEATDDLNDTKGQCEIEGWCPAENDNLEM